MDLGQFIGTEKWFKHPLVQRVLYTEGVQYFCEQAGAYWFLDIVATELFTFQDQEGFLSIHLIVTGSKAKITADDGNGNILWTKNIDFTDAPEGDWKFYFTGNVVLLTSEY